MRPAVVRLPWWLHFERPWMVIGAGTVGWFPTWDEAQHHAIRIAA